MYDLIAGKTGVRSELSAPIIEKGGDGRITRGVFRTKKEAEQTAHTLISRGRAVAAKVGREPSPQIDFKGLGMTLEIGPDVRRLALKMCIALSSLLPDFDLKEIGEARLFLRGDIAPVINTIAAFDRYEAVDSIREALAHVIYVERGRTRVYGLVQFFGAVQLFCRLGLPVSNAEARALLAALDPVTGKEQFSEISPLDIAEPPETILIEEYPKLAFKWLEKLREESVERGATHPPDLRMSSIAINLSS